MPEARSGDEVDLLDSSIRTVAGALVITVLYAISGIVYAAVTSPEEAGRYLFVTLVVALAVRPFSGVSRTLHKRGSEAGEDARAYFGLTLIVGIAYTVVGIALITAFGDILDNVPIIGAGLALPIAALLGGTIGKNITSSLLAAVGYPGYKTWVAGGYQSLRYIVLLLFASQITTAADIIYVTAGTRAVAAVATYGFLRVRPMVPSRRELRQATSFAKWSIPDQIIDRLSYNMPVYVLGVVASPTAVAVYETADRFADFGASVVFYISSPVLTKVSGDWSNGGDTYAYLDGAATGGAGVTLVLLACVAATSQLVAQLVFPTQVRAFTITILAVGAINVFRGVWTILSHALEGVNKPGASVRTKVYGLLISVPPTVFFGATFGALAGAGGYVLMNTVIGGYVLFYTRKAFGRLPFNLSLGAKMAGAGIGAYVATVGTIAVLTPVLSGWPVVIAASFVCFLTYSGLLGALSSEARRVYRRTGELCMPL